MFERLDSIGPDGYRCKSGRVYSAEDNSLMIVPKQFKIGGWIMWFQAAFEALAIDNQIDGNTRRVLDLLMSKMDWENWIGVNVTGIADVLGMHKSHVSRSLKQLVEAGVLIRGDKIGRCPTFKLNHNYAWKGKAKVRNEEILKQYRNIEDPTDMKSKAKAKTGTKKKVQKPAKSKGKLKLVRQKDGEL